MTRFLFNILTLSLFLMNQAHAFDCFLLCNAEAQEEKSHGNHDYCEKTENSSRPEKKNNCHECNTEICILSSHNSQLMSIVHISLVDKIKETLLDTFFSVTQLPLKHEINFSAHLSYNNGIKIVPSIPIFIRVKHLLI